MKRTLVVVAVSVVGVVGLSSCGGDEATIAIASSTTRATTTTTSTTSTTAASTTSTTMPPTSVAPTTAAPPPTAPPTARVRTSPTWDEFRNASIPAMCEHPPTRLVDGKDVTLSENQGYFELNRTLQSGATAILPDIPSEVGPLTAVVISCNAGGVAWPNSVMFFQPGGTFYAVNDLFGSDSLWASAGLSYPGREGVISLRRVGNDVEVFTSAERPDDASCCPSGFATVQIRVGNGSTSIVAVAEDVGD